MRGILEPYAWNPVDWLETVRVFLVQHATFSVSVCNVTSGIVVGSKGLDVLGGVPLLLYP
jgi:hypothetical protein